MSNVAWRYIMIFKNCLYSFVHWTFLNCYDCFGITANFIGYTFSKFQNIPKTVIFSDEESIFSDSNNIAIASKHVSKMVNV